MKSGISLLLAIVALGIPAVHAQGHMNLPKSVEAGSAFSMQIEGSGKATLYIVGPGEALKRDVQLGETTWFAAGSLSKAGHYVVLLASASNSQSGSLDVLPANKPANLTFIAKPSRLPVALHGGITGTAYVFDSYQNLITTPLKVSFELSSPSSAGQTRSVETRYGAASTEMDSTPREANDQFVARIGDISSTRVVGQVPGDPCSLKINSKTVGDRVQLQTDPVKDCNGNAIPDGTIVTFTELSEGSKSTVDVPLKQGVAKVEMPAHRGAMISVASGVVLGNQIRLGQ